MRWINLYLSRVGSSHGLNHTARYMYCETIFPGNPWTIVGRHTWMYSDIRITIFGGLLCLNYYSNGGGVNA